MKISRILSGPDGGSYFGEIEAPLRDAGKIGMLSELQAVTGIIFRETSGDYDYDWHNTPRKQYVIILEGGVDFTVSGGETRRFSTGDVILLEDTTGKGHRSKAVDGQRRKSIFVTLD